MSQPKLNRLLEAHDAFSSKWALKKNFGDSFLLEKNHLYARIRGQAHLAGFQFSDERNDFYTALSLSQLENILQTKTISYTDNVSVLKSLPSHIEIFWDDIQDNLKKNYLFHESCHAVARHLGKGQDKTEERKILQVLLEESFANTCEFIAVVDAKDPVHRTFYEWNSYTFLFEERTHLEKAINDMGEKAIFNFLFYTYLQANFLRNEFKEKDLQRILALSFTDVPKAAGSLKTLKYLSKIAFSLDQRFREVTASFHLRLHGFQKPLRELLNFDFLKHFEHDPSLRMFVAKVGAVTFRESESPQV